MSAKLNSNRRGVKVTAAQLENASTEVLRFETPMAALERAFDSRTVHANQRDLLGPWSRFEQGSGPSFYGFEGPPVWNMVDPMRRELAEGWPEGGALLSTVASEVTALIPLSRKLKIESDHVHGFDPHIPTLFNGSPFAFRQWGKRPRPQVVRIAVNTACSAIHDASTMVWSGAVALVLADLYTQAGYSVELWTVDTARGVTVNNGRATHVNQTVSLVCAKRAEDPMLVDLLASVVVSPRFTRAVLLPLAWQTPLAMPDSGGSAWDCTEDTLAELAPDLAPMVCLPRVFSKDDAIAQINSTIDRLSGRE